MSRTRVSPARFGTIAIGIAALAIGGFAVFQWSQHDPAPKSKYPELDRLAERVEALLRLPPDRRDETDEDGLHFDPALRRIATIWPHERFREPLLRLLGESDPDIRAAAASSLLFYDDPELRAQVERYRDDGGQPERPRTSEVTVGELIRESIEWIDSEWSSPPFETIENAAITSSLLSEMCPGDNDTQLITVERALRGLESHDASIRLQATLWLLHRGLVLELEPVLQAWPDLSSKVRQDLMDRCLQPFPLVGRARLRAGFERLFARREADELSEEDIAYLLLGLAALGSDAGRDYALQKVENSSPPPESSTERPRGPTPRVLSISYLMLTARGEDRDRLEAWRRRDSSDQVYLGSSAINLSPFRDRLPEWKQALERARRR